VPIDPIDPDALAESVARLEDLDPADAGLDEALDLVAKEADDLFPVDGAGIMLLSEGSVLRYVAGSDLAADPRWPSVGPQASRHGIRAVLGVPIGLRKGPVGTLNVYTAAPHAFDEEDLAAIQAYARVVASLLRAGVQAHVRGRAATQLQYALDHRVLIEQAKGVVMERRKLDEKAAFELLRSHARSTRMPLDEVARQVIAGGRLTR
jgi:GAF domain-containing protein